MAVCEKCIIPDTFPGITLEQGICDFCRDYEADRPSAAEPAEPLEKVLQNRSAGRYDCLVPLSGGKDSCYALYYIVRELGLKPFAVFFNSGFSYPLARKNVDTVCRKLGVEWATVRSPHDYRRKAVIEAVHMSRAIGRFFSICKNCENNLRSMAIHEAANLGISTIIWGSTGLNNTVDSYHRSRPEKDAFHAKTAGAGSVVSAPGFMTATGLPAVTVYRSFNHAVKFSYYLVRDNFDMKAPGGIRLLNPAYHVPFDFKGVRTVYFYKHVPYNPAEQVRALKEIGWEAPIKKEYRMDCRLHCLENYAMAARTGLTSDGFDMACLVRAGLMDREEALNRERKIQEGLLKECLETLRFLGFRDYHLAGVPAAGPVKRPPEIVPHQPQASGTN